MEQNLLINKTLNELDKTIRKKVLKKIQKKEKISNEEYKKVEEIIIKETEKFLLEVSKQIENEISKDMNRFKIMFLVKDRINSKFKDYKSNIKKELEKNKINNIEGILKWIK